MADEDDLFNFFLDEKCNEDMDDDSLYQKNEFSIKGHKDEIMQNIIKDDRDDKKVYGESYDEIEKEGYNTINKLEIMQKR